MKASPLSFCLDLQRAQARLRLRLDDALGTLHGVGWDDFVLLSTLADGGGRLALRALAEQLATPASMLSRRLAPLEKTGLLARQTSEGGAREVLLRSAGRRVLQGAAQTARATADTATADLSQDTITAASRALDAVARADAASCA